MSDAALIRHFQEYIRTTAKCQFNIYGIDDHTGIDDDHAIGYIHRWTPVYRSAIFSKFYQLQGWWEKNRTTATMLTLTTYQDGRYSVSCKGGVTTIEESFRLLKKGWMRLSMWLRKYYPTLEYVWMTEPHKTGYPHIHVLLFGTIPQVSQEKLRRLWEKYGCGSYENGLKFTPTTSEIKNVKNYLVKYIQKTFTGGKTGSKYAATTEGWSYGELLFNAVMWKNKFRLWGASAALSKVMAKCPDSTEHDPDKGEFMWEFTELQDEHGDTHVTGKAPWYNMQPMRPRIDLKVKT